MFRPQVVSVDLGLLGNWGPNTFANKSNIPECSRRTVCMTSETFLFVSDLGGLVGATCLLVESRVIHIMHVAISLRTTA